MGLAARRPLVHELVVVLHGAQLQARRDGIDRNARIERGRVVGDVAEQILAELDRLTP